MDNSLLLLIIIKKEVNIGAFIWWYQTHDRPPYKAYLLDDSYEVMVVNSRPYQNRDRLGTHSLTEFEYNYLVSALALLGAFDVKK